MSCCTAYCDKHGFAHGAEAEELRDGIEKLCRKYDKKVPIWELEELLAKWELEELLAKVDWLERVAEEREKCAKICADIAGEVDWPSRGIMQMDAEQVGIECVKRIRGEQ